VGTPTPAGSWSTKTASLGSVVTTSTTATVTFTLAASSAIPSGSYLDVTYPSDVTAGSSITCSLATVSKTCTHTSSSSKITITDLFGSNLSSSTSITVEINGLSSGRSTSPYTFSVKAYDNATSYDLVSTATTSAITLTTGKDLTPTKVTFIEEEQKKEGNLELEFTFDSPLQDNDVMSITFSQEFKFDAAVPV
jgi:hypothetical protein